MWEVGTPSRADSVVSLAGRGGPNQATSKEAKCTEAARNITKGKGPMEQKRKEQHEVNSRHCVIGEWRLDPEVKL